MYITTYIVRVCDSDPLAGEKLNVMPYKFHSLRRAKAFAEDALSRGFFAVLHAEHIEKDDDDE